MPNNLPEWFFSDKKKDIFLKRSKIIGAVREFFIKKNFIEVETPALLETPDPNPNIQPFTTLYTENKNSKKYFLSASPEHAMKIILCSGFGNIFQITKFFRNGETSELHNPEFTGLEWYEVNTDYHKTMETCEELFFSVAKKVLGTPAIRYQGKKIDLTPPWERISVREAFIKFAQIDLYECETLENFKKIAACKGEVHISEEETWESLYFKVYLHYVERKLTGPKPIFLTEYPAKLSSLARKKNTDNRVVERFEVFAGGMELGNAFSELNDPIEQEERFIKDLRIKYNTSKDLPVDYKLINAIKQGMPPCGGIALGIDRLVMLLLDCPSISDVVFFPLI